MQRFKIPGSIQENLNYRGMRDRCKDGTKIEHKQGYKGGTDEVARFYRRPNQMYT
jgi:hypothetical protein